MAYWNPFGWDEETRRGIQSIVRPVMQVASFAGSMGAFSGGSAAAGTGATDPGTAPTLPEGVTPGTEGIKITDIGPDGSMTESFTPDGADGSLAMPDGSQLPPSQQYQTSPMMSVPTAGELPGGMSLPKAQHGIDITMQGSAPGNVQSIDADLGGRPGWDDRGIVDQFQQQQMFDGSLQANTGQIQLDNSYKPGDELNQKGPMANAETFTHKGGKDIVTETTQQPKPTQTTQQPGKAKPPKVETPTTETPNKPPATKTPDNQHPDEVKPPQTEGPGPGGAKKWWDGKAFNWENIQKFLASDEGKKWMLSDKGLMGIGGRIIKAADAGTSAYNALSPEERKKIIARLKKEREERKRKKRRRERSE